MHGGSLHSEPPGGRPASTLWPHVAREDILQMDMVSWPTGQAVPPLFPISREVQCVLTRLGNWCEHGLTHIGLSGTRNMCIT